MRRQSILLTGATGAVGSDLLRRLATRKEVRLNVLVRRADRDPCERVKALLGDVDIAARLNVLEGDICIGPTLGLSESVAIQSVTLALLVLHGQRPSLAVLRDRLTRELLTGVLLGVACGAIMALVTLGWLRLGSCRGYRTFA